MKNKKQSDQLTKWNVEYRRDSAQQLISKLYNKKYSHCRIEILNEISLKYFALNAKKEQIDLIHTIYFRELSKDSYYKAFIN